MPRRTRTRLSIDLSKNGRTKQSFKDDCNINQILAKYKKTGVIDHVKAHGEYIDAPTGLDYHAAQNLVLQAQQTFDDLPAHVRKEFENNPALFLTFVEDEENIERMLELGLIDAPEEQPGPIDVNVIPAAKPDENPDP